MQRSLAGFPDLFLNECGALGIFIVVPAPAVWATPRNVNSSSPSRIVNISSKSCRCGGGPPPWGTRMSIRQYPPPVSSPDSKTV